MVERSKCQEGARRHGCGSSPKKRTLWPPQRYTLPKYTSLSVALPPLVEVTMSVWGPPAPWDAMVTRHRPVASVELDQLLPPPICTVTVEPGASKPHTGAGWSCWMTMWSPKALATEKFAAVAAAAAARPEREARRKVRSIIFF